MSDEELIPIILVIPGEPQDGVAAGERWSALVTRDQLTAVKAAVKPIIESSCAYRLGTDMGITDAGWRELCRQYLTAHGMVAGSAKKDPSRYTRPGRAQVDAFIEARPDFPSRRRHEIFPA